MILESDNVADLSAALAKAQGAMKSAALNRINPHFEYKYADLASIIESIRAPLADNGLSFTQTTEIYPDGNFILVTKLRHASGQWVAGTYPLPRNEKQQIIGSALTYARRYCLQSIVGISADDDDDAEAANVVPDKINAEQLKQLEDLCAKIKRTPEQYAKHCQIKSLADLPVSRFAEARAFLEALA